MLATMQDSRVGKRPIRSLTLAEKLDAIDRVRNGESKASVARDIGVPESTLRGWCKSEEKIRNMARRNASTPNSNPNSPASSSGGEPPAHGISSGEDDDITRPGPSKRRRVDNGVASSSSYSPPPHNSENIDIKPKMDYVSNLINSLMGSTARSENSILLQQLAAQNAANLTKNILALQNSALSASGLLPQTVGLVENGLQYTKTNSNGYSSKRHSLASTTHYSAIAPTTQIDNKSSRKSLPAAAEAPSTLVPASPRKTNEYQNGMVAHQQYQTSSKNSKNSSSTNGSSSKMYKKTDEAMWLWLSQQHLLSQQTTVPFTNPLPLTPTVEGSWFWQWYKQSAAMSQLGSRSSTPTAAHQQPQYQQQPYQQQQEQQQQSSSTPLHMKTPSKAKATLDQIFYNKNNVGENGARRTLDLSINGEATEPTEAAAGVNSITSAEAIEHGRKFAEWLGICSDPAVSQLNVLQVNYMLHRLQMERPTRAFKQNRK